MFIKQLTNEEFKNFSENYPLTSIYQTVEYALVMNNQNFESFFVGLVDNTKIVAASLILVEKKAGFNYGYAPRGFLIDYNNFELVKTFTKLLKPYLNKLDIVALKLCPLIEKTNDNYNVIFNSLKKLGFYHFGYNNYFESLKPRFDAIININQPYHILFKSIKKEFRTKIRNAAKTHINIYKGNIDELNYLYNHIQKKYNRDLDYFKDTLYYFKKRNAAEYYYAKLDTKAYLESIQNEYATIEKNNISINNRFIASNNSQNLLNKKLASDIIFTDIKNKLIYASKLLADYPEGIVLATVIIVKHANEVFLLMDGYDKKFKSFNAKHLLIWKLIEKYNKLGYKILNLGGISNPNLENNKYQGLINFKLNFNAEVHEYIGDLELIVNNTKYFMYQNALPISNILKR